MPKIMYSFESLNDDSGCYNYKWKIKENSLNKLSGPEVSSAYSFSKQLVPSLLKPFPAWFYPLVDYCVNFVRRHKPHI